MSRVARIGALLLLSTLTIVHARSYSQESSGIRLDVSGEPLLKVLDLIQHQSDYIFLFSSGDIESAGEISLQVHNLSIEETLRRVLENTGLTFEIEGLQVVLRKAVPAPQVNNVVRGRVLDSGGEPVPGASIIVKGSLLGTVTDASGRFTLVISASHEQPVLICSFLGMKSVEVPVTGESLEIRLEEDVQNIADVVVTGIYTRRAESYTGSAKTFTGEELKKVSPRNLFQSLRNLDPTLYFAENLEMGSNPNALPDIQIRGVTTFPGSELESGLKGNYMNKPNQPLFILDGFEASVERIFDLDMNLVETLTILKDAAAKAIYGSKAANGVVIIETKKFSGSETRISYNGLLTVEMPDLTSYNLCDAAEKLEAERIDGMYSNTTFPEQQLALLELYNSRRQMILEGLDTYWLSKPLRTSVAQQHSLIVEMGDSKGLRNVLSASYNRVNGVMKGSFRETIGGQINISFRTNDLQFRNNLQISSKKNEESPYGAFSEYTKLNPYWRAEDPETGRVARWAELSRYIPNPMYDAQIGTRNRESTLDFSNNFYVEWFIDDYLKATGRIGVSANRFHWEKFLPADHSTFSTSSYMTSTDEDLKLRRGSYTMQEGRSSTSTFDLNVQYNRDLNGHLLFGNAGMMISDANGETVENVAEGFPSNKGADITFARQYAKDSRPTSVSTLQREISFLLSMGYSFNDRYSFDLSVRHGASSLYGKDNRWSTGWGTGISWNIHKENFMKELPFFQQLRLRGTVGKTGAQSFNRNRAISTYSYYKENLYQGMTGAFLEALANPDLRWVERTDYNAAIDFRIPGLNASFELFRGVTHNSLADVTITNTSGFKAITDNIGEVVNSGFDLTLGYTVFQNRNGYLNLFGSVTREKNVLEKVSAEMRAYNEMREAEAEDKGNPKPVLMYRDGQAINTIWAVPSLGIDPMNGNEIYVKQDGSLTYEYAATDLVAAGIERPEYRGNAGLSAKYKGFELNVSCRFEFGGETYNQTLVDRVENVDMNYNVDRRVLQGRWQTPGQVAAFKRLGTFQYADNPAAYQEKTRLTTRFVQKKSDLYLTNLSIGYDVPAEKLKRWKLQTLRLTCYMNDFAQWSSVKLERGLSYPYSHKIYFSLSASF